MHHTAFRRLLTLTITVGTIGCAGPTASPPVGGARAVPVEPAPAPPIAAAALPQPSAPTRPAQIGRASWYGHPHHGRLTASGEVFDMYRMTAAHPTLALGTRVRVTNLENGRSVYVRVNDRGPVVAGRIIDLSYAAARSLGAVEAGVVRVSVVPITAR
jgi:peptidoglycan lytic transglycosylase